jgi:hypothetical protein
MKFLHAAAFAVILTVAGSPALRAQEPDQDREKPKQQEDDKKKQPPPAKEKTQPKPDERKADERKPDERKPDDRAKTEPDRGKARQETDRQNQTQKEDDRSARREQNRQEPKANRNDRNENEHREHRTNVRRIPEESFRVSFGREHHFRVARRDDRRFEYGGYIFEYVDAWPPDWSYDDDCYIEQDGDDYYLVNARHPGARVLVVIVG